MNEVCEPTRRYSKKCVIAYCPSPPNVTHAKADFVITHEMTKVGSSLPYTCAVNFHPVGSSICLPDGMWSEFRCESEECPVNDAYTLLDKQNLCFKVSTSFEKARDHCRQSGGRLIILDSEEKNNAILDNIITNEKDPSVYTIGLTDEQTENVFV
ncbi:uncharacterized protein LOC121368997 [Gigantopelta aegis]|uniref:uncharacterized protein LOC121368997 n=1 Tax=Gigantopelta aegis TaxID=1735272 RepID=UPI001B889541|nr:uncharacterized protein LOC121368997 [Gigantopelta aegis]